MKNFFFQYQAKTGVCRNDFTGPTRMRSYVDFYTEAELEQAVSARGPVAVYIHANSAIFSYRSGVLSASVCSSTDQANHAVVVVGYNNLADTKYWIIQNSWGSSWGDNGYLYLEKGKEACKIGTYGVYPIV